MWDFLPILFFLFCFALSSSLSVSPSCLKMTHAISGNSTACASCVCRPSPMLWVGAGDQRGVNAHVLCVFVIFSAHQKQNLNRNVSTPIALLRLSCLNLFGTISLLPFRWKGKPVGVWRCAGWLFLWLYLSLFPSTEKVLLHVPEPVLSQICKLLSEPDCYYTNKQPLFTSLEFKNIF